MNLLERAIVQLGGSDTSDVSGVRPRAVPRRSSGAPVADPTEAAGAADRLPRLRPVPRIALPADALPADAVHAPKPRRRERAVEPPKTAGGPIRLDDAHLASRGFLSPSASGTRLSSEFRSIKRPLLGNAFGRDREAVENARRIMVASAYPDEGKSFCAINLALSIAAERDQSVLLVDADVARPSLPGLLDFEQGAGLIDLILDPEGDVERFVRPTSIEKLSILSAGRMHAHATELIASDAMARVLSDLTDRFPDRVIVFDSPPVLMTTESRVLASHMGQVMLVVASGSTPRAAITEVLEAVQAVPVVGLVFNKSRDLQSGAAYSYNYGYGHDTHKS
jgi:protein-tyrosine kinase